MSGQEQSIEKVFYKPNRAARRKESGVNKTGLYRVKEGRKSILVLGKDKFKMFIQVIKDGAKTKRIVHTM